MKFTGAGWIASSTRIAAINQLDECIIGKSGDDTRALRGR
jgi:hypothetical protein